MLNKNTLLYGHEDLPPEPIALQAGELTMLFEPDNAFLRYIRLGDHEIVRSIYAVVRDQNWNTIPWKVENLKIDTQPKSFSISFDVQCSDGAIQYFWRGAISGNADGKVTFSFDGEARSDFQRNRIGICVLHPIRECAGKPCALEHTNGAVEQTELPQHVSPWQPLRDVRAITTNVAAGIRAEVRFEGDIFETEDQRNYGDTSFKTYSTPQELPKPVQVKSGDRVQQRVTISLPGFRQQTIAPGARTRPVHLSVTSAAAAAKPAIGLQAPRDGTRLTDRETERIRRLRVHHLRADIKPSAPDWREDLRGVADEARRLELPLHLALHLGAEAERELKEVAAETKAAATLVALWIVQKQGESFPSPATVALAQAILPGKGAQPHVAAAASPFFTEMNRSRPGPDFDALACYPVSPQIHLSDRFTVMENIADVSETIATARTFLRKPVVVSPITLRRSEPKTGMKQVRAEEGLPNTVDPRQMSLFAAAWTLGHIAELARAEGLHSATYFETIGWRGIMESEQGSPMPSKFFSIPGAVFPVYHVFADMAGFDRVQGLSSTRPNDVAGLMLSDSRGRTRVLMASLLPWTQQAEVSLTASDVHVRRLNANNAEEAMRTPDEFHRRTGERMSCHDDTLTLSLSPYEVVSIDWP